MNTCKVAVVGSRDFNDYELLKSTLFDYFKCPYCDIIHMEDIYYNDNEIISGGARGVDSLAEQFAKEYGFQTKIYQAEWDKYGKSAGYIRNQYIIADSTIVFAFWDGKSKGTNHSIELAKKMNKELRIIMYEN